MWSMAREKKIYIYIYGEIIIIIIIQNSKIYDTTKNP